MKTVKITINEKEVEVQALKLRKILEVLKFVKTLPEKVRGSLADIDTQNVKNLDTAVAVGVFADIISESSDEIIDIIAVASGLSSKEIEELGISDTAKLFKALLEVNDIEEIKKELGELGKMFKGAN
jgi:hypothetical protein